MYMYMHKHVLLERTLLTHSVVSSVFIFLFYITITINTTAACFVSLQAAVRLLHIYLYMYEDAQTLPSQTRSVVPSVFFFSFFFESSTLSTRLLLSFLFAGLG